MRTSLGKDTWSTRLGSTHPVSSGWLRPQRGQGGGCRGARGGEHLDELMCFLIVHRKPHEVLAGLCLRSPLGR